MERINAEVAAEKKAFLDFAAHMTGDLKLKQGEENDIKTFINNRQYRNPNHPLVKSVIERCTKSIT